MIGRLIGLLITFAIVGYLLYSFLSSGSKTNNVVNNSPAMQEQQKTLQDAGVDTTDPKALQKYTIDQAKQIEQYQNQASPPTAE